MIPGNSTPVTRPALVALPAVTDPGSGNTAPPAPGMPGLGAGNAGERVTEPAAGNAAAVTAAPETRGALVPMTVPERAAVAVRHWSRDTALELWLHPDRLLHALWFGRPDSMAGHREYIKSRKWVPEELKDRKSGGWIAFLGVAYHVAIARPVKLNAKLTDAAADRPLRFAALLVFRFVIFRLVPLLIVLHLITI